MFIRTPSNSDLRVDRGCLGAGVHFPCLGSRYFAIFISLQTTSVTFCIHNSLIIILLYYCLTLILITIMQITLLYFWALLPMALRLVTALPPPQEPLVTTESIPVASAAESANLPLVVWHGLGDKYVVHLSASASCHYTHGLQLQS